jgi:hypothetical protein
MLKSRSGWKRALSCMLICGAVLLATPGQAYATHLTVPDPEPGSFFTLFDYLTDGRAVAFDGFTVFVQESLQSTNFVAIGTLPEEFRGATDPAFMVPSPDGSRLILGGGAGGSKFPDPAFNGTIFQLPTTGGVATLIGTFPFSILGTFRTPSQFVFGQGETFGEFTGSVELLDLNTGHKSSIVGNIPGDPGGVEFDASGNLYVGLGSAQDQARTGEIRRFTSKEVAAAVRGQELLDFDTDSRLVAQVLNAGDLEFDTDGDLFVGGGDLFGPRGDFGYIAQVNVRNGRVVDRFDPTDGNPNDHDFVFFEISFTGALCQLGALDLESFFTPDPSVIFERQVCAA